MPRWHSYDPVCQSNSWWLTSSIWRSFQQCVDVELCEALILIVLSCTMRKETFLIATTWVYIERPLPPTRRMTQFQKPIPSCSQCVMLRQGCRELSKAKGLVFLTRATTRLHNWVLGLAGDLQMICRAYDSCPWVVRYVYDWSNERKIYYRLFYHIAML